MRNAAIIALLSLAAFSPALAQTPTRTRLVSSPNPSNLNQGVRFTATVDALGGGIPPINYVTFSDGAAVLGSATLKFQGMGQDTLGAGYLNSCALTQSGGASCWGLNGYGQLGDGTTTTHLVPTPVSGLSSGVVAISAGLLHTCALTVAGAVRCWGDNFYGQLGDGTTATRLVPTAVSGLTSGVAAISAGRFHSCALTVAGAVKCWGSNYDGELGDGTTTNRLLPTPVSALSSGVAAIAAGYIHTCALTFAGAVKCWGYNGYGQLGDGTTTDRHVPTTVLHLASGAAAISTGERQTCAVTVAGAAQCWGDNLYGQLGDGTTTERLVPTPVLGLASGVAAISTGSFHTCAVAVGGGAQCWGFNGYGRLGDGTTTDRLVPGRVATLTRGVLAINAGYFHTCASTITGAMQCWGYNAFGELGDGTVQTRGVPRPVSGFTGLSRARAQFPTAALGRGAHPITANYHGEARHAPSADTRTHTVQ